MVESIPSAWSTSPHTGQCLTPHRGIEASTYIEPHPKGLVLYTWLQRSLLVVSCCLLGFLLIMCLCLRCVCTGCVSKRALDRLLCLVNKLRVLGFWCQIVCLILVRLFRLLVSFCFQRRETNVCAFQNLKKSRKVGELFFFLWQKTKMRLSTIPLLNEINSFLFCCEASEISENAISNYAELACAQGFGFSSRTHFWKTQSWKTATSEVRGLS